MRPILLSILLAAALSSHHTAPGENPLGRAVMSDAHMTCIAAIARFADHDGPLY